MRRKAVVTIQRAGRDQGKSYTIEEMSAVAAEDWFFRAMQFLARSGADVPPNLFDHGAAGFAAIGIGTALTGLGKSPYFEVKPLLDEMLKCIVSYQAPGAAQPITMLSQILSQTEEFLTVTQLREEILSLHLGFSLAAKLSEFRAKAASMAASLQSMSTSAQTSAPSSREIPD